MPNWIVFLFLLSPKPFAVYEGSTQCPVDIREFHSVTHGRACDKITWRLEMYGSGSTGEYVLTSSWGYYVDNVNWELRGTNERIRGTWQLREGAPGYTRASVYVLTPRGQTGPSLSLMKVNENILQLMTPDNHLFAGGSDFSNTLSRTEPVDDSTFDFVLANTAEEETSQPLRKIVLEGRTPSGQIARELGIPLPPSDPYNTPWPRVKWKLSLRFDAAGQPSTFEIRRITDELCPVNGVWRILQGWKDNPGAVVIELDMDDSPHNIYLLKGSRDVYFFLSSEGPLMVGNGDYAYTLNRSYDQRLLKD